MYGLRDCQKSTSQHDTKDVHTKGISKIVPEDQISKVIEPPPYCTLLMSISKDVPHSMTPKLFTQRGIS